MNRPARRDVLAAIGTAGVAVAGTDGVGGEGSARGFATDFEFPTTRLDDHGWTVANGSFRTENSYLVAGGGDNATIYRRQTAATGRFEFRGVRNSASFYGIKVNFIADRPSFEDARGYRLIWVQHRDGDPRYGDIELVRADGDDRERLLELTDDHDGRPTDVRIERDPDTWTFDCYLDGEHVGSVTDDTYTSSSYWVHRHDTGAEEQRIDGLAVAQAGTDDGPSTETGPATAVSERGPPTEGTEPPSPENWLDGWYPLLAWLVGVPILGPLVLAILVAATDRDCGQPPAESGDET